MDGFDLTIQFFAWRLTETREFSEEPGEVASQLIPVLRRAGEAFCIVFGIFWFLASDSLEFVVHPVIHVEDEIGDGVWKSGDAALREVSVDVFDARSGVDMGAFAVEEFDESLHSSVARGR